MALYQRVVADADRAGDVIRRVRNLVAKVTPSRDRLDMVALIEEVLALTRGELRGSSVALHTDIADDLPQPLGDKMRKMGAATLAELVRLADLTAGKGQAIR